MGYLGNDLKVAYSTYKNIDDISGSFNGSTTSFSLLVGGVAPSPLPLNSQQCLISVGGVVQRPDDTGAEGFRLSGGNIVFSSAPGTGEDFFGVILAGADYVNVGANFPSGSAAVPSITFDSDLDTGIYNSAANQVSISTAGSERLRIDSAGQVEVVSLGTASAPAFSFTSDSNTGIYSPGADQVAISTGGSGRLFVNSSGLVGIGTSSPAGLLHLSSTFGTTLTTGLRIDGAGSTTNNVAPISFYTQSSNWGTQHAANVACGNLSGTDGGGYLRFSTAPDGNTAPAERLRITAAGLVGIGNTAPEDHLSITANNYRGLTLQTATSTDRPTVYFRNTGAAAASFVQGLGQNLIFGRAPASDYGSHTETARIDSSGRLLVGTSTATNNVRLDQKFGVVGVGAATYTGIACTGYSGTTVAASPVIDLQRSRGTTDGSFTKVESGDRLGIIAFRGADGTQFLDGALIEAYADAATGTNDLPTRLVFSTTADGASSPTERMRIPNGGGLSIGSSQNPNALTQASGLRLGNATLASYDFINVTTSPVTIANGVGIGGLAFVQAYNTSTGAQYTGLIMWRSGVVAVVSESNSLGFALTYSVSGSTLRLQTASGTVTGNVFSISSN